MDLSEHFDLIALVTERVAKEIGFSNLGLRFDRLSFFMDLDLASEQLNLDLDSLLKASKSNFNHDIYGIASNIDRESKSFAPFWSPRHTI